MTFSPKLFALTLAAPLALGAPALADTTGEMIDSCVSEMQSVSGPAFADTTYKFKGIRGSSTKKLSFEMKAGDMDETVVCKVRRGSISAIEWPETVVAALEIAPEAPADKS